MIAKLIRWSVANRFLVLLATLFAVAWGIWSIKTTPIDALPDLSDVQVIIRTSYPGQAPRIVENQVTYPLATTMMSTGTAPGMWALLCRPRGEASSTSTSSRTTPRRKETRAAGSATAPTVPRRRSAAVC